MEKEFLPYQEALALKELGFDYPCFGYWFSNETIHVGAESGVAMLSAMGGVTYFKAPIYQQAFRFLSEKYEYFCSPTESVQENGKEYDYLITKKFGIKTFIHFVGYKKTIEEAELACIIKLIEIIKENEI